MEVAVVVGGDVCRWCWWMKAMVDGVVGWGGMGESIWY